MNKLVAVTQLALCLVFVACNSGGGGTMPSELVGRWVIANGKDKGQEMELFKDGTGIASVSKSEKVTISWKVEGKRFVITTTVLGSSVPVVCDYKLSGYVLTVINDEGEIDTLVRKEKFEEFNAKQIAAAEAEKAKKVAEAKRAFEQLPKFTDSRDNKVYRKVPIGGQTWMAENLNYVAEGSKCYENSAENCAKYGRLYNWATAKTACPTGWHLPSDDEWTTLTNNVDGTAGKKLKSSTGWNNDGNGTNEYLFSALPGGNGYSNGSFSNAGNFGSWWSATEGGAWNVWDSKVLCNFEERFREYYHEALLFSVRCVQD
jgi:uncharacterized protein (TIGR02145 family)